ncbi:MAG: TIGR03936 family radical SAM-associated protein [Anaerolineales bacterium]
MKAQRIRIRFAKTKAMQYTGHLDLRQTWARTFRRANLALAYSQGYTPHPQLNLAAPLPLGFLSTGEIGDFWLEESYPLDTITEKLQKATPPGIKIKRIDKVPDIHGDKLPNLVTSATYVVTLLENFKALNARVQNILKEESIIRERKGKSYDLRPLVHELKIIPPDEDHRQRVKMTLSLLPGATGRPDELIKEMGIDPHKTQICRREIHLDES